MVGIRGISIVECSFLRARLRSSSVSVSEQSEILMEEPDDSESDEDDEAEDVLYSSL